MRTFENPSIDWAALSPELALLAGSAVVVLGALLIPKAHRNRFAIGVSVLSLLGGLAAALTMLTVDNTGFGVLGDAIRRDHLAELAQVILIGTGLLAVLISSGEDSARRQPGEFYGLLLAAVAGMAFFVAANNLLTLFLGLEWFSICLYILSAIATKRERSLEAGLKYLIVGSFGSAILLFGGALVFGATGALGFEAIAVAADSERVFLVAGLAMLIVGLGFKVSAAPFHQWTPDVYGGAPTAVTGFMAAATKVAAMVVTLRVMTTAFDEEAELWTITLAVLATASLAWGNIAALVQRDLKRLLAYSSVSHAGFLLMPIAAGNALGGRALLFYLIPYSAMTLGSFAIVAARERELGQAVTLDNVSGLGWEKPLHGAALATFMLGFIGLPPTGLFLGKFYAFSALFDRGWIWLMVIGAVFTAVSVYYYLGVVRSVYLRREARAALAPASGASPRDVALTAAVVVSLVVAVGSFFGVDPLIDQIRDVVAFLPIPS